MKVVKKKVENILGNYWKSLKFLSKYSNLQTLINFDLSGIRSYEISCFLNLLHLSIKLLRPLSYKPGPCEECWYVFENICEYL